LGVNVLVSAFVPASIAITGVSFTHDLVYDTPAADLINLDHQKMLAVGATEAQAQALLANRWFSLSVLTAMVGDLERLAGVRGRAEGDRPRRDRHQRGGGPVSGGERGVARPAQRDWGPDRQGAGRRDGDRGDRGCG